MMETVNQVTSIPVATAIKPIYGGTIQQAIKDYKDGMEELSAIPYYSSADEEKVAIERFLPVLS